MIGDKSANPRCKSPYAFGLVLALKYLEEIKGINHQSLPDEKIKIGNVILPTFPTEHKRVGGYQNFDAGRGGLQMLLNYRVSKDRPTNSKRLDRIADRISIENFTNLSRNPTNAKEITKFVKNRIVIIGVTDKEFAKNKLFQTPYQQEITPIWLHAQMISQILSGVIDRRPFLRPWFGWENVVWISAWSLVGGLIIWRFRSGIHIVLMTSIAIIILYGSYFILFYWQGLWTPLIPPALILVTTSGIFILYIISQKIQKLQLQISVAYKKLIHN